MLQIVVIVQISAVIQLGVLLSHSLYCDMVPVATVEQAGFKKLMKLGTQDMSFPVAATLQEKHCHKCKPARKSLADWLANMTDFASTFVIKQDMWALHERDSSLHWSLGDENSVSPNKLFPPGSHIATYRLAKALQDAITRWKLQEKYLVAITTVNVRCQSSWGCFGQLGLHWKSKITPNPEPYN